LSGHRWGNSKWPSGSTDEATKDDEVLQDKLRKATGVSIADLAHFAEHWPDV